MSAHSASTSPMSTSCGQVSTTDLAAFSGLEHRQARWLSACAQLVDDQRLDEDRALVSKACAEPGAFNQRREQTQVGVRRDHHVKASPGFQAFARLVEQRGYVAIFRPGVPGAIGQTARLAGGFWWARHDHVERRTRGKRTKQARAYRG